MKTLTLTRVFRKEKTSAKGRAYTSLGIQCQEYPGKWLNGFGSKDNSQWKPGDKVEVDVVTKGDFLNFNMPKAPNGEPLSDDRLTRIEQKLDKILAQLGVQPLPPRRDDPPEEPPTKAAEPEDDSVPF